MESLLTAPLVEKLLKDEIDVLISVDPMFNDDRWVRREIYRESFFPFSTPEQQDGGIEPPPVLASRFFRFLNLP